MEQAATKQRPPISTSFPVSSQQSQKQPAGDVIVTTLHGWSSKFWRTILLSLRPLLRIIGHLADVIGAILYLTLPSIYEHQASIVDSEPSRLSFIQSILEDWQSFNFTSGALLSIVFAMLQLGIISDKIDVQTAGFACISCATVSFVVSSVLLFAFRARSSVHNIGQRDNRQGDGVDMEAQQHEMARRDICLQRMLFDDHMTKFVLWNNFVLIALPVIWTSWAGLGFVVFLSMFAWSIHGNTSMPSSIMQVRSLERDLIVIGIFISDLSLPGLIVTIVLAIGALYLVLVIWTLCRMRPGAVH